MTDVTPTDLLVKIGMQAVQIDYMQRVIDQLKSELAAKENPGAE